MTPLALGIGSSPVHAQPTGLAFRYAPGITAASLGATYSGGGSRTYIDSNGVLQTTTGLREWLHYINGVPSLLLEGLRTNSFLNSGAPASHTSPSLGAGTYTLWLVGTGSIAVAAGTATITGAGTATSAAPVTFTVTVAGTVTFTVTGAPTRAQCENGAFATSYIATVGAAVTRPAETLSFPWIYVPQTATAYIKGVELGTIATTNGAIFRVDDAGGSAVRWQVDSGSAKYRSLHNNGTTSALATAVAAPSINDTLELRAVLNGDGSVTLGQAVNAAADAAATAATPVPFASAWPAPTNLYLGSLSGTSQGFFAFQSIKFALGARDLPAVRAA